MPSVGVTHNNTPIPPRVEFRDPLTFSWVAPAAGIGPVVFRYSMVQVVTTWWANDVSAVVQEAPDSVTQPTGTATKVLTSEITLGLDQPNICMIVGAVSVAFVARTLSIISLAFLLAFLLTKKRGQFENIYDVPIDPPAQPQYMNNSRAIDNQNMEVKNNEAYSLSTTQQILTEDNIAYGQATPQIPIEDNVAYGQATPQIPTEDNIAYSQATPQIPIEDNVAYGQATPQIPTEDNIAYGQATPHIPIEDNVAYGQATPQIPTEDNIALWSGNIPDRR